MMLSRSILTWLLLTPLMALPAFGQPAPLRPLHAEIDEPVWDDPHLEDSPSVTVFHPRIVEVWKASLGRPDADTRRRAAEAIGRAHEAGAPGMQAFIPLLREQLTQADQHPLVRGAAARALVRLDAQEAAAELLDRSTRDGMDMVIMVDPALVRWDYAPARQVWLSRISDRKTSRTVMLSAMDSLVKVGEVAAAPSLKQLIEDPKTDGSIRLHAARAYGGLMKKGAEPLAKQFAGGSVDRRLSAVAVLAQHDSPDARATLLKLLADKNSVVVAAAGRRLLEIDPLLMAAQVDALIKSDDPSVRNIMVGVLRKQESPQAVALLAGLLDDVNTHVREDARQALLELDALPQVRDSVRHEVPLTLKGASWRGLEQAALLLGKIDHEPAASQLYELLYHDRSEASSAAAAALRWMAASGTEDKILSHIKKLDGVYSKIAADNSADKITNEQEKIKAKTIHYDKLRRVDRAMAQLIQMLGQMRYAGADDYLRKYIPKDCGYGSGTRTSAIWSLAYLHEDADDATLRKLFISRLSDTNPLNPESDEVRRASAIALGRMKSPGAMNALGRYLSAEKTTLLAAACRWSMIRISGQELAPLPTVEAMKNDFFISPIKD